MARKRRKRALDDVQGLTSSVEATKIEASKQGTDNDEEEVDGDTIDSIQKLSLEAVFHPKFENENRDLQNIRQQMKDRISLGKGYLEVSLKHSGTLLLWSGGQRYYSKNSTGNSFTYVGELLLRQHFYRAWGSSEAAQSNDKEEIYKQCSKFVDENRFTLAFECVTSVLGHHGDLPNRDFLILTAVADRARERFLTTSQLLEFAHRYRLPHNDVWVYSSLEAVGKLFYLYDNTRETGLATDTIASLNESADGHVSSMYPHVEFQGNILEGIVIRYVGFRVGEEKEQGQKLQKLAAASQEILAAVPPEKPATFETISEGPPVMTTNIRDIYRDMMKGGKYGDVVNRLGAQVLQVLGKTMDGTERRSVSKKSSKTWNIPKLVKELLKRDGLDSETKRIASVIQRVASFSARVDYAVFLENSERWLCIIHVIHDTTFKKYQQRMAETDMHLFRGFCVEVGTELTTKGGDNDTVMEVDENSAENKQEDVGEPTSNLMLKMKLLPYMVRTFCCRNGLKLLKKGEPKMFTKYTMKLMSQWGISSASKQKWQRFFVAWANYAHACINGSKADFVNKSLPPMNEQYYLNHLEHFTPLYEAGKFSMGVDSGAFSGSTYRSLVVVVSLKRESAKTVADYIARELGGVRRLDDIKALTEEDLTMMRIPRGGGLVVSAIVEDPCASIRKHLERHGDSISVVLFGCDPEAIDAYISQDNAKTIKGMTKGWGKTRCKEVISLKESSLFDVPMDGSDGDNNHGEFVPNEDFKAMMEKIKAVSTSQPTLDTRSGFLVFYPTIPGCGKSTISGDETGKALVKMLEESKSDGTEEDETMKPRKLIVLMGDKVKKKYWQRVQEERAMNPSSLYITDKNAPPMAWPSVGEATGSGLAIPVICDERALSTTTIVGVKKPSGRFNDSRQHCYPFSLHYLAVCMARVLSRPPKSHAGKLDSGTPAACMIVGKFFSFYRHISAEDFTESILRQLDTAGAMSPTSPIEIPFFKDMELPALPEALENVLVEAIQLQFGFDLEKRDTTTGKDRGAMAMEEKLREAIEEHKDFLFSLTVDPETSRQAFIDQLTKHVREPEQEIWEQEPEMDSKPPLDQSLEEDCKPASFIKLASIDVPMADVHNILKVIAWNSQDVAKFLETAGAKSGVASAFSNHDFVPKTHVTMAHFSHTTQQDIRSKFETLVGKEISISVTAFLWSDRVAALAVEVAEETGSTPIPRSNNEFVHITVWNAKGANAVESNTLPQQVSDGSARRVGLDTPVTLRGNFSFWT